jgi:hypothetical protein
MQSPSLKADQNSHAPAPFSRGQWARLMAALARDFHVFGSGFLAELTAVFLAGLHRAAAGQVCTFLLVVGRHDSFSFSSLQLLR